VAGIDRHIRISQSEAISKTGRDYQPSYTLLVPFYYVGDDDIPMKRAIGTAISSTRSHNSDIMVGID